MAEQTTTPVLDPTDASGADGANGSTGERSPRRTRSPNARANHGDFKPPAPKRGRRGLVETHIQPQEPDYSKMPARSRAKAKREFQAALEAWKEHEAKEAEATIAKAKAPKSPARRGPATSNGAFNPEDKATRDEVVRLKQEGLTIKAIAEKFGLPAVHKSWLAVSLIWRSEADARGIPRHHRVAAKK